MTPIKKVRLSESILDAIRQMIVEDGFAPGDKFYSEKELTEKLEVSRSSVREALRILEVTGQVAVRQGKGIFVMHSVQRDLEAFAAWLRSNEQSILDHFEARLILEPKAAAKAAQNASPEDLKKMEACLEAFIEYADKGDIAASIRCDREFHRLMARASHNETLHFLMKYMTNSLPDGWISSLYTPGRIKKTKSEHREVMDAVASGNAQLAQETMTRHLEKAMQDIKAVHR